MILTYLPLILYDQQAEMVNKALQTQRTFLKMASTHQEPAEVRHTETDWRTADTVTCDTLYYTDGLSSTGQVSCKMKSVRVSHGYGLR